MSKVAFVFVGSVGLDRAEVRGHVLRIPEVSLRMRKAQEILDAQEGARFDLFLTMNSDDATFLRYPRFKSLAAAIVQVGLADRAAKGLELQPSLLIGPDQADSALHVVTASQTFEELVRQSPFATNLNEAQRPVLQLTTALTSVPLVAGLSPISYKSLQLQEGRWITFHTGALVLRDFIQALSDELRLKTIVLFGPGGTSSLNLADGLTERTQVLDSIELDPQLSWFWSAVNLIGQGNTKSNA